MEYEVGDCAIGKIIKSGIRCERRIAAAIHSLFVISQRWRNRHTVRQTVGPELWTDPRPTVQSRLADVESWGYAVEMN